MPQDSEDVTDLSPHLTNTSLQTHRGEEGVRLLDELIGCTILSGSNHRKLSKDDVDDIINQASEILADAFRAALATPVHFQVSPTPRLICLLH
jgi:tubulin---tyrosine ligase